jgi:basic amino acid/polyamine antiporter, APA family
MSVLLLGFGSGFAADEVRVWPETLSVSLLSGIGLAMIGTLWAYEGWQYVTFSAGETISPQRTFPRGIVIGTVALIVIYLLANLAYIAALGPEAAAASDRVAADAVGALLGRLAGKLIAAGRSSSPCSAPPTASR